MRPATHFNAEDKTMTTRNLQNIDVSLLNVEETLEVFKTLDCPTLQEMNGEFRGRMLSFPTLSRKLFWTIASKNPIFPGIWQGKSFRAVDKVSGRGYNIVWRLPGGCVDIWPMQTRIGPSYFDGRPSFQLVYRAFDHYAGDIHMLDEVRRLDNGRYLGIGRTGSTVVERRLAMPFLLVGPVGRYRADIGTPRGDFDMGAELELLELPKPVAPAARARRRA